MWWAWTHDGLDFGLKIVEKRREDHHSAIISMDRLVKVDVEEVEMVFQKGQKCSTTFKLTNLMHIMSVAVSLTTSHPSLFSFNSPFSVIPPLSSSSYTLLLSHPSHQPPFSDPPDLITVRTALLPTGKAHLDDLRRLFSKPGRHLFRDALLPVSFVGPHAAQFLISNHSQFPQFGSLFKKAISGPACAHSHLTPLLRSAIEFGTQDSVSALIDAGADVNFRDSDAKSLIPLAVRVGEIHILKLLLASGCSPNHSVDSSLHEAAAMNRVDLMEALSESFGNKEINSVNSEGRTPIHVAALHGHVEAIQFCVSNGGNPNLADYEGWTPLHCAASRGQVKAVECLLECSNAKYAVNKDGKTAFSVAVENGHSQLPDLLHWDDVLFRAARKDDVHGLTSCVAEGARVNGKDQNGWSPLHWAAFKGRMKSVKLLIEHGAEIDAVDDAGYTPLHCAAEAGHFQVALFLISRGSPPNLLKTFDFDALAPPLSFLGILP
ncbi:ankyrin repeat domain-containing protein 50-like [Senna tora]|uniref:Ankyrin repeat domain-containing protein 50-like n=1 Tax=Senna tora TaxID=362788 RepID=A0A834SPM8_9FABA|nr:ankyrin repeat domain-containing protein 50-like [Senna tora]